MSLHHAPINERACFPLTLELSHAAADLLSTRGADIAKEPRSELSQSFVQHRSEGDSPYRSENADRACLDMRPLNHLTGLSNTRGP